MKSTTDSYVFNNIGLIGTAKNRVRAENPPFTLEDFYTFYPQFQALDNLPDNVVEMYIQFANQCVNIKRWGEEFWQLGMCLFVAHFCSIYLMGNVSHNADAQSVLAAGQIRGLVNSKSVGDVSIGYDFSMATQNVSSWGQFNLTLYGNQFVSIAKLLGKGGMYIW